MRMLTKTLATPILLGTTPGPDFVAGFRGLAVPGASPPASPAGAATPCLTPGCTRLPALPNTTPILPDAPTDPARHKVTPA